MLLFTQIVEDCKKDTLIPIIQVKIELTTMINADSWKSYDVLVSVGHDKLFRVNYIKNEFALKEKMGLLLMEWNRFRHSLNVD